MRHGTTTLFAALDVANGTVLAQCKPKHRHQEFLAFLRHSTSATLSSALHTNLHSWLNQIERWFALITTQAIRRESFDSVTDLKRKIDAFVKHYNQHPKPFMWTATAESILVKIKRLCKIVSRTKR